MMRLGRQENSTGRGRIVDGSGYDEFTERSPFTKRQQRILANIAVIVLALAAGATIIAG